MTHVVKPISLFTLLIAFLRITSVVYCEDISYEEVCTGYEQNMRALGTYQVEVSVASVATEEHVNMLMNRLSRYDSSNDGKRSIPPGLERSAFKWRAELEDIESRGNAPVNEPKASLTVGVESLHVVLQDANSAVAIPNLPLMTQHEMIGMFSNIYVISWSRNQSPSCWIWQGYSGRSVREKMYATLSAKRPTDAFNFPVPPLGDRTDMFTTRSDQVSVIDQPFRVMPDAKDSVLGTEDIDGISAIVLERRSPDAHGRHLFVKTWVDPNRGYLPLRIESWRAVLSEVPARKVEPFEIVTVSKIKELSNLLYYPVSWTIENRQDIDRTPEETGKERVHPIPKYTYRVTKWSVSSVLPNVTPPPLLSEIGFPRGTYCFDETKNEYFTVGSVEAVVDATIQSVPKVVQSPPGTVPPEASKGGWTGRRWFLLANVLVTVGLAVFAAVRVYRADRRERGAK